MPVLPGTGEAEIGILLFEASQGGEEELERPFLKKQARCGGSQL
jgi:hypothetical protein